MTYQLTHRQYKALEGLAYWVADASYIAERYGSNDPELVSVHRSISDFAPYLDSLKIPFWVQNTVSCFAENWRQYKEMYLDEYLETRGITRA